QSTRTASFDPIRPLLTPGDPTTPCSRFSLRRSKIVSGCSSSFAALSATTAIPRLSFQRTAPLFRNRSQRVAKDTAESIHATGTDGGPRRPPAPLSRSLAPFACTQQQQPLACLPHLAFSLGSRRSYFAFSPVFSSSIPSNKSPFNIVPDITLQPRAFIFSLVSAIIATPACRPTTLLIRSFARPLFTPCAWANYSLIRCIRRISPPQTAQHPKLLDLLPVNTS
ncbi:hypothetical protein BCR44DRAFT_1486342, partial [Catenaria anguillulae PL171]